MRAILILVSAAAVYGGVIKNECVNVKGINYDLEVLLEDIERPYLLAVDHSTNILYFSYSIFNLDQDDESDNAARLNLNTKEFANITGVNNGFAQTVDQKTHTVYIGGSDGIYKYDDKTDNAVIIGEKDRNIYNLFFKDVLYVIDHPRHLVYTFENGQMTRYNDMEHTRVDHFAIDINNTIIFANATGLYSQEKGTKNRVLYREFPRDGARGLATDLKGEVYVCLIDGIYAVNKKETKLEKILHVEEAFGLAFDSDNNIVYANGSTLIRLKPRGLACT